MANLLLIIYGVDYCCIITSIRKSEARNLENIDLNEKSRTLKNVKIFYQVQKRDKEILTFGDIETEKHKSYIYKSPNFKKDVEIENIFVSNKISSCENNYKHFIIGYLQDDYVYKKDFMETKINDKLNFDDEATDFNVIEIPKAGSDYTCLVIITIVNHES